MNAVTQIEIAALEITLVPTTRTESSACFEVINSGANLGKGASVGWVDVHYPCEAHIRLTIHAVLPERLIDQRCLHQIAAAIQSGLQIKPGETMTIRVCSPKSRLGVSQSIDEKGNPGMIQTTRRFTFKPES